MTSRDVIPDDTNRTVRQPIAVIGIGCRLPGGVDGPESFWKLLVKGGDAITDVPLDRWNHDKFYHPEPGTPGKTVACQAGFVSNVDSFDYAFFGISPREAGQMDPQHRLVLEVSWEAIEDAGITQEHLSASRTGVFVGIASHDYSFLQTPDSLDTYASTGLAGCMAAHRVSYAFNLIGPSLIVDTACSSTLVAVHLACNSIWDGESTMALAGGVNVLLDPTTFVSFSKLSMLSPDSRCQAFDARANGFVRGEGAGMVVLKPLSQARADGDSIYAVILGTGVNQDGHSQGITFPNQASQEKLLQTVSAVNRSLNDRLQSNDTDDAYADTRPCGKYPPGRHSRAYRQGISDKTRPRLQVPRGFLPRGVAKPEIAPGKLLPGYLPVALQSK